MRGNQIEEIGAVRADHKIPGQIVFGGVLFYKMKSLISTTSTCSGSKAS